MSERAALVAQAIPDFLHSMRYALTSGQPRTVLWYWEWISTYLWRHGQIAAYLECDRYALAAAEQLAPDDPATSRRLRATISAELAFAHLELGDLAPAERYVRQAEKLYRQVGDPREVARVLRYHATLRGHRGDYDSATALCQEALDVLARAEQRGPGGEATSLSFARSSLHNLLGTIALEQEDYATARRELVTALALVRAAGEDRAYWSLAKLFNLGRVYHRSGVASRARRHYERCLALTADGTNPNIRAYALDELAHLLTETTSPDDGAGRAAARRLLREALTLYEAMGKWHDRARAGAFLATISTARRASPRSVRQDREASHIPVSSEEASVHQS